MDHELRKLLKNSEKQNKSSSLSVNNWVISFAFVSNFSFWNFGGWEKIGCGGREREHMRKRGEGRIRGGERECEWETHDMPHIYSDFVHIRKKMKKIRSSEYIYCCDTIFAMKKAHLEDFIFWILIEALKFKTQLFYIKILVMLNTKSE